MHSHTLDDWRHDHVFLGDAHDRNERRTWAVVALTATMMVVEIAGGTIFGSMALLADGWHMSTHAAALTIAAFAYRFARRHARDPRFAFGTGKLGDLAAFASAIVLAMVALLIAYESVERFFNPVQIAFNEAIPIAFLGLIVNLVSAFLLRDDHHHHHGHGHERHQHRDLEVLSKPWRAEEHGNGERGRGVVDERLWPQPPEQQKDQRCDRCDFDHSEEQQRRR